MKLISNNKRSAITITIIGGSVFLLTRCVSRDRDVPAAETKIDINAFAGSESCAGCHKDIYNQSYSYGALPDHKTRISRIY